MSSEGTPLHGDRGVWNVMDFDTEHGSDINDSTLRRHLPLPGAAGGLARSDGTDWQRISSLALADIAGYVRGYIIRGGASDWEAYDASTSGFILVGDGTDIASVCFDWDTMAGGASADMVHSHASAGEGGQISHDSALTGVSADDHHNEIHIINSTGPHAETGLTIGHFLRATGATAFSFAAIAAGDLPTAIDAAKIADGSVSNTEFQYLDDYATIGLVDLTAAEVNQLENIAATTISAAQWTYLGAMNQGLATTDSPTFNALTATSIVIGANTITTAEWANLDGLNQTLATTSGPTFASLTVPNAGFTGIGAALERIEYYTAGYVSVMGANFGIGTATPPGHFTVYDSAINTTATYYGNYNYHRKTLGATDHNDHLYGSYSIVILNQVGGEIGQMLGQSLTTQLIAGSVGDAVNTRFLWGISAVVDLDGGTVTNDVFGIHFKIDQEAANTVADDMYAMFIEIDALGTVGGDVYMLYLQEGNNIDYGIYQNGTAINHLGGYLGLGGTTLPQGLLHGYDAISGFLHKEFDALAGVAQTIIPNGAGDVLYYLSVRAVTRASDGGVQSKSGSIAPGNTIAVYDDLAGNVCTLTAAADGSVTIVRTAGALTYKVALWLLWL